jgi:hypothetical protein
MMKTRIKTQGNHTRVFIGDEEVSATYFEVFADFQEDPFTLRARMDLRWESLDISCEADVSVVKLDGTRYRLVPYTGEATA